ncbi:MAG: N-acetyl-gamma-glutamyl-phosphate reductase [Candidatus Omnitrophica bacterium]|nr:N-acetyl-gamma-glutamyl-phosphate reductase [Candidatus Omnitrophota bacterium]
MTKAGVIGISGYTGEMTASILLDHPKMELCYVSSRVKKPVKFSKIFPQFRGKTNILCRQFDAKEACLCDILFLALPHTVSQGFAPLLLKGGKRVIDLSADYRIKNTAVYKTYYKVTHSDKRNLKSAVYGMPELYKDQIKRASLVANPGCYPTASLLALAPLVKAKLIKNIIIDAKSGISGAGRKAVIEYQKSHSKSNLFGYKAFTHQHAPEIEAILSGLAGKKLNLQFMPHVIPAQRGIYVTIYADLTRTVTKPKLLKVFNDCYRRAAFVRVLKNRLVHLDDVLDTNFCDISVECSGKKVVIFAAIDNLIKGAAGQAVQNANIMLGFNEKLGLE